MGLPNFGKMASGLKKGIMLAGKAKAFGEALFADVDKDGTIETEELKDDLQDIYEDCLQTVHLNKVQLGALGVKLKAFFIKLGLLIEHVAKSVKEA